jgi:hypothetical protein
LGVGHVKKVISKEEELSIQIELRIWSSGVKELFSFTIKVKVVPVLN